MCCKRQENTAASDSFSTSVSSEEKLTRIALISYQPFDASEWLQNMVKGLDEYQATHSNVEIRCMEALQVDQYEPRVRACAETGYDIIITTFEDMANATIAVAKDYPNIKFGTLQGGISNLSDYNNIAEFRMDVTANYACPSFAK